MRIEELNKEVDKILKKNDKDALRDNGNLNGETVMGQRSLLISAVAKEKAREMINKDFLKEFDEGYVYLHDSDFMVHPTTNCIEIPFEKMLKGGFENDGVFMREPKSIRVACELVAILFSNTQNFFYGGIGASNIDYDLAPYVRKSFNKRINYLKSLNVFDLEKVYELAMLETIKETEDAFEGLFFNLNVMKSRTGQSMFSSLNFGLDTSWEGRLISKSILKAQKRGLGKGETGTFPILAIKLKKGINMSQEEPNYDIYQLGLECLSKRLFPNFLFVDAPFNLKGFDIDDKTTHVGVFGCRSRIFSEFGSDKPCVDGRGNLSFITVNLPMVAKKVMVENKEVFNFESFIEELDKYIDLSVVQLLERMEYQKTMTKESAKLIFTKMWKGSEEHEGDTVGDLLKTGSLSVGYIGLAETLKILIGEHHGESLEAQELGLKIISHMRNKMDKETEERRLNFALFATPAETYCMTSLKKFVAKYGVIEGISDREFFTNSNHIPVYFDIAPSDKIRIEAPYHELANGGNISYIEIDGDTASNLEALDDVVKLMSRYNIGYGSINVPVDKCRSCGCDDVIPNTCPMCGGEDISRIRRITGYLTTSVDRWNSGKASEEKARVKHVKNK